MNPNTIIVGTGYLGRRCRDLPGRVVGLARSSGFDLDNDPELPMELSGQYAVLYTVPPSPEYADDVRLARMIALLDPRPARFVYISTTGVYGDCRGELVDESRPVHPESARARLRVDAEQQLQAFCSNSATRLLILRAPGIYGPGRLGIERIRAGEAVIREADANPGNRIHVDDLAKCCAAALAETAPAGIYNVGDGDHRSASWFAAEVARQIGVPEPPQISYEQAQAQFTPMRLSFLRESRRIDTRKMREVLGVMPVYADPVEGIRQSLQEGETRTG